MQFYLNGYTPGDPDIPGGSRREKRPTAFPTPSTS